VIFSLQIFYECGRGIAIAVIDCTGHGVPGAFMTMIASSGLRRIIRDEGCHDPAEILKRLNFIVKTTLRQDTADSPSDDGLDAAICFITGQKTEAVCTDIFPGASHPASQLIFAGARLPLFYILNGELKVIKGDRQSVGYKRSDINYEFANHVIPIKKGTAFYMATDGFADQLGGERYRRFGSRRFKNLLKKNARFPLKKQRDMLIQAFEEYKGKNERQDDVTVVGFGFR